MYTTRSTDIDSSTSFYNITNNTTGEDAELNINTSDTMEILYVLIGTLGIIGNLIVIVVFASDSKLRKTLVNMYIINQSCIDGMVSVTVIGLKRLTSKALNDGAGGVLYCLFWQSRVLLFGFMTSSTYNLLCLTVERYAGVVHPIWHKLNVSHTKTVVSMLVVWIFGFVCEAMIKFPTVHILDGQCIVYFIWPSPLAKAMYGTFAILLKLLVPLVVLIYCYTRIVLVLQRKIAKTSVNIVSSTSQLKENNLSRGRRNTIKTLFTVGLCFALCWTWNQINFYRSNLGYYLDFSSDTYHTTVILVYINSCINPFIYAFRYQQFQVGFTFICAIRYKQCQVSYSLIYHPCLVKVICITPALSK